MEIVKILQFVASLSLLVIIHELGHFLFARMFGVRVEKFYLFFNPGFSLVKFKVGQTEYGIGWIPFGGYVKLAGMIDESMDTEQMKRPPQPWELRTKPAWQRLLVMSGGVLMNVVLAIVVYIGMSYTYGETYIANDDLRWGYAFDELGHRAGFEDGDKVLTVGGEPVEDYFAVYSEIVINNAPPVEVLRGGERVTVDIPRELLPAMLEDRGFMTARVPMVVAGSVDGGAAEKAGLLPGDSLVALDGVPMAFYDEFRRALSERAGSDVELTVMRDSAGTAVLVTVSAGVSDGGELGLYVHTIARFAPLETRHYTLLQAIPAGVSRTWTEVSNYWKQIVLIFSPETGAYKSVGGFISIGSIFPAEWSWPGFWTITAFISLALAVLNILPVPPLDGGHILFLLYEVVTRRRPSDKFMEYTMMAGWVLLFALLVFANGNDIYRFFIK